MKKFYASLAALLIVVSTVVALNFGTSQSQAAWDGNDCSSNAIIKCGVDSRSELKNKVDNSTELKNLYNHFGVSSSMISSGNVKEGVVHKNGNVTVDGKIVATDAWSVGREYKAPDSQKFTVAGKSYYKRPTTNPNIFRSGAMTAFVFFDSKGNYVSTIIKSCGNPVFANAKPKPQPPKPTYACASLSRIQQNDDVSYIFRGKATVDNGAKYKGFTFDFGDSSENRYVAVGRTSDNGKYGYADVKHTYTKSGTYNVKVTAHFTVNGKEVTHTQANCAKPVTIKIKEAPKPKNPGVSIDKQVRADATDGMTKEEALEQARNFKPKPGTSCATVMTPAVHLETGARFTFGSSCLPNGWVAERNYNGQVPSQPADWVEHAKVSNDKPFEYRLVVKNTGDVDLKNVAVSDPAPAGIEFTAADKGTIKNNVWTYTIPTLKVNQSVTVIITAKVAKANVPVDKPIKNTACVDAKEVPGDKDDCDDATVEVEKPAPKPPKLIEVCELATGKIIEIKEADFDADKHSKDLSDCDKPEEPTLIEVCELVTGEIIEINEKDFDAELHSRDLSDCDEPEEPAKVEVCNPETGEIITVDEDEADNYLPVDAEECDEKEVLGEKTPEEIPSTGAASILGGIFGSSALGLGITSYVRSRFALGRLQ